MIPAGNHAATIRRYDAYARELVAAFRQYADGLEERNELLQIELAAVKEQRDLYAALLDVVMARFNGGHVILIILAFVVAVFYSLLL